MAQHTGAGAQKEGRLNLVITDHKDTSIVHHGYSYTRHKQRPKSHQHSKSIGMGGAGHTRKHILWEAENGSQAD